MSEASSVRLSVYKFLFSLNVMNAGGGYARRPREPLHRPPQGLREGIQEQHQERRKRIRVLQINTPIAPFF